MSKSERNKNPETNRDNLKDSVMSETDGDLLGIETNTNRQILDPSEVNSLTNKNSKESKGHN